MKYQQPRDSSRRIKDSPEMHQRMGRDDRYDTRGGGKSGPGGAGRGGYSRRDFYDGDKRRRDDFEPRDRNSFGSRGSGYKYDKDNYYKSLKVTNFPSHVSDSAIRDALFHEFKKFGDVKVKVTHGGDDRIAFVNYAFAEHAKEAKLAKSGRLTLFGKPLYVDPVYRRRSVSPDLGYGPRSSPGRRVGGSYPREPGPRDHDFQPYESRRFSGGSGDSFRDREPLLLPEDDPKATRTLFVGNLEGDIPESELKHVFQRFGIVEDIDVKRPARGQGNSYAFVRFCNLDQAHKAKIAMQGKYIGRNQAKIGYGKAQPTTRLWVGGLGPWTSLGVLEREFDRFGAIRKIDYMKGDNFAFILYDSLDAAQAAASNMRGFPLGGPDHRLRLDFAESSHDQRSKFTSYGDRAASPRRNQRDDYEQGFRYNASNKDFDSGRGRQNYGRNDAVDDGGYRQNRGNWQENRYGNNWSRPDRDSYDSRDSRKRPMSPSSDQSRERSPDRRSYKKVRGRSTEPNERTPEKRMDDQFDSAGSDHSPEQPRRHGSRGGDDDSNVFRVRKRDRESKSDKSSRMRERISAVESVFDLQKYFGAAWHGFIVLKNSAFCTRMHLLDGDISIVESLLGSGKNEEEQILRITQRLRLDQPKLEEVTKRITSAGTDGHCLLLALPAEDSPKLPNGTQSRTLRNLVTYLQQKEAAGVISLPVAGHKDKESAGILHAFPPCQYSLNHLLRIAPNLGGDPSIGDHLVIIIVRGIA
ncbi:RNA-binding protein 15-like [Anneissia japonica]|uniref:RNA-binding protein 15-like n=1 Tax=Anneissia japonica TaxID=1529436 RepID=UPI0014258B1D|nr:RNA-binding protein 15-like [Anneissia japonica]